MAAPKRSSSPTALSRALGAAFLQHQVAQLESQASASSQRGAGGRGGGDGRGGGRGRGRRGLWEPSAGGGSGGGMRILKKTDEKGKGREVGSSADGDKTEEGRRIPHLSVLLYALPVLKSWLRAGHRVLIPLHLIAELDKLKSQKDVPEATQAREAIRFLESQFARYRSAPAARASEDGAKKEESEMLLLAQGVREEVPWGDTESHFRPFSTSTHASAGEKKEEKNIEEDGKEMPLDEERTIVDCPSDIRPLIQCALWRKPLHSRVYIYSPSSSVPLSAATSPKPDANANGGSESIEHLAAWLTAFGITVVQVDEGERERATKEEEERRRPRLGAQNRKTNNPPGSASSSQPVPQPKERRVPGLNRPAAPAVTPAPPSNPRQPPPKTQPPRQAALPTPPQPPQPAAPPSQPNPPAPPAYPSPLPPRESPNSLPGGQIKILQRPPPANAQNPTGGRGRGGAERGLFVP
ncbi:hypothetical protein BT69DRAFT_500640 [Atractiella rhizophila]|nr:hypothetical protein BT69DRAFT_500640 [Atractiella rhizophila]